MRESWWCWRFLYAGSASRVDVGGSDMLDGCIMLMLEVLVPVFNIGHAPHLCSARNWYNHGHVGRITGNLRGRSQVDCYYGFLPLAQTPRLIFSCALLMYFSKMLTIFWPYALYSGAPYKPTITARCFCKYACCAIVSMLGVFMYGIGDSWWCWK